MRNLKVTAALTIMVLVALGAGVVTGKLTSRAPVTPPPAGVVDGSPLSEELQLTPTQREQMRQIWEGVRKTAHDCATEAQAVQREQERQLISLMTDDQKARYEKIAQTAHDQIAAADARRQAAFSEAVDKTSRMLNDDQRRAYRQIIRNRVGALPGGDSEWDSGHPSPSVPPDKNGQ